MASGDDVTGLHAFDDLDPVSTVSALNVMPPPQKQAEAIVPRLAPAPTLPPKTRTLPPGQPGRAPTLPPPPARGGLAGGSVPPRPLGVAPAASADETGDADTKVVPYSFPDESPLDAASPPSEGDALTGRFDSGDGAEADEPLARAAALADQQAPAVAARMSMEWDEEEAMTRSRDESGPLETGRMVPTRINVRGTQSLPQPSLPESTIAGNPSPFGAPRPVSKPPVTTPPMGQLAPVPNRASAWEDDDDALTRVKPTPSEASRPTASVWDTARVAGASTSRPPTLQTAAPDEFSQPPRRDRWALVGLAAAALIGLGLAARALLAPPDPGTITLVTQPADARVSIDGRSLAGQTSPFTVQGLVPGAEHVIEVTREGFAAQTQRFHLDAGEVRALPTLDLVPLRVDTGFALSSDPPGAAIYVDGRKLEQVTPTRITDLAQGLHLVRLEGAGGLQPWETQVALATGQVIELPTARLVAAAPVAQPAEPEAPHRVAVATAPKAKPSTKHGPTSSAASSRKSSRTVEPAPARAPTAHASAKPSAAAAHSGGGGTLRVNSRPWAQIYVDGRMIGNTPQLAIALPAGNHDVKLVNPQLHMSRKFSVRIQSGKVETKIVDLIE